MPFQNSDVACHYLFSSPVACHDSYVEFEGQELAISSWPHLSNFKLKTSEGWTEFSFYQEMCLTTLIDYSKPHEIKVMKCFLG